LDDIHPRKRFTDQTPDVDLASWPKYWATAYVAQKKSAKNEE